ncbi:MAG: hypothetical protein HFF89_08960, partial [Oscillibacter sp.]|nr:hypothetical protein [Oscillibacter sp.]
SSYGNADSDWSDALRAMADGRLQTDAFVTHILRDTELIDGLALMRDHTEPFCKITIKF